MSRVMPNMVAICVITIGGYSLTAGPASGGEEPDECHGANGSVWTGGVCCVSGETGSCYTGEEICTGLFCEEYPNSSVCEGGEN